MTFEFSEYVKTNITYQQETFIMNGYRKAKELELMVEEALGVAPGMKVVAKNQTMIYGPPGVGKTYTTRQTCEKFGIQPVEISNGASVNWMVQKLAYAEYYTPPGQPIVVIWDDADQAIFGDKKEANRWKMVFQDEPSEAYFNHDVNLTNLITTLEKDTQGSGPMIATAIRAYMPKDALGINIPMARFKHIFLCNTDYEYLCTTKGKSWMMPIVDRFKMLSLSYDDNTAWGWLSLVLLQSQPYARDKIDLSEEQKISIIRWLRSNWNRLKMPPSYRKVKELAENIINEPNNYLNRWERHLRPDGM